MISKTEFAQRRQKLISQLDTDCALILPAAPMLHRNGDTEYPYRPDSDFYYLTGFAEPHAALVLLPGNPNGEFILFNQTRDPEKERWTGERLGQERAREILGADQAFPIETFAEKLHTLLQGRKRWFVPHQNLSHFSAFNTPEKPKDVELENALPLIHELRLFKSSAEIVCMQQAADISVAAHLAIFRGCKPNFQEYALEALFVGESIRQGARYQAYESIVAGGSNATILHYAKNNQRLKDGELVLIDAGCEFNYYASDITRTIPINGKFSAEQKLIYEMVLDAQLTVIAALKPGASKQSLQTLSEHRLTELLVAAGILKGSLETLIEQKAVRQFYYHGIGHWIGLDVHDVGSYTVNEKPRLLQPNMLMTVEPGLYFSSNADVDPRFHGIGVRIEDDVLVTASGNRVLTQALVKTVSDIEREMAS